MNCFQTILLLLACIHATNGMTITTVNTFDSVDGQVFSTRTWEFSHSFCQDLGMRLPTYEELCMDGEVTGGSKSGDKWAAVVDQPNQWIQVGTVGTCRTQEATANRLRGGIAAEVYTIYCAEDTDTSQL